MGSVYIPGHPWIGKTQRLRIKCRTIKNYGRNLLAGYFVVLSRYGSFEDLDCPKLASTESESLVYLEFMGQYRLVHPLRLIKCKDEPENKSISDILVTDNGIGFVLAYCFMGSMTFFLFCKPMAGFWDPTIKGVKCYSIHLFVTFALINTGMSHLTDKTSKI